MTTSPSVSFKKLADAAYTDIHKHFESRLREVLGSHPEVTDPEAFVSTVLGEHVSESVSFVKELHANGEGGGKCDHTLGSGPKKGTKCPSTGKHKEGDKYYCVKHSKMAKNTKPVGTPTEGKKLMLSHTPVVEVEVAHIDQLLSSLMEGE
jgi:hypothetical protein